MRPASRLLVIDDDSSFRSAFRRALSDEWQLTFADGAESALDQIEGAGPFDAILCDLHLQDGSGIDLFFDLVERSPEHARRFVIMTGGLITLREQLFFEVFEGRFLEKPFTIDDVRSVLTAVVRETLARNALLLQ